MKFSLYFVHYGESILADGRKSNNFKFQKILKV
jgi:hypothetical protein